MMKNKAKNIFAGLMRYTDTHRDWLFIYPLVQMLVMGWKCPVTVISSPPDINKLRPDISMALMLWCWPRRHLPEQVYVKYFNLSKSQKKKKCPEKDLNKHWNLNKVFFIVYSLLFIKYSICIWIYFSYIDSML